MREDILRETPVCVSFTIINILNLNIHQSFWSHHICGKTVTVTGQINIYTFTHCWQWFPSWESSSERLPDLCPPLRYHRQDIVPWAQCQEYPH